MDRLALRLVTVASCCFLSGILLAQDLPPVKTLMLEMAHHESVASEHREHFTYLQYERSDRTAEHLWLERVVETQKGKIQFLLQEDGTPLSEEREKQERGRLQAILDHPEEFLRKDRDRKQDESHARDLLQLLPKAYLFDDPIPVGTWVRVNYRPNPSYVPHGIEERVLHGTSGYALIDPKSLRLHYLEGHLAQDVSFGFGLLGTVHAGSNFAMTRELQPNGTWKTVSMKTHIDGKILFFKTLSRQSDTTRKSIVSVRDDLSLRDAIAMAEQ